MTPQLGQLLVFVGVIAGVFGLIWAAQNAARRRGQAEQAAKDEAAARKAEQDMTDEVMKPSSPEITKDKLNRGEF